MYLRELILFNFKNYTEASFEFSEKANFFGGNNGIGKTNLLDAIYYTSFCKSFFNPIDSQNIQNEKDFFMLKGEYFKDVESHLVQCSIKRNQKKVFKLNKKAYERLADHIGKFPLVMVSPADVLLIIEGSETRRKFIDSIIAQCNKDYLENLLSYNKALSQRNSLLKQMAVSGRFDSESISLWNDQLIKYGKPIYAARAEFIAEFIPIFQMYYTEIAASGETVLLEYESKLHEYDFDVLLESSIPRDRALNYTTNGVHKDDLTFFINNFPVKKFASQGQQKTFLLSLRLAQAHFISEKLKINPIVLLDDIYDKLDDERLARLISVLVNEKFGQLFITDTHSQRIPELFLQLKIPLKTYILKSNEIQYK
jgi:DNA replication and repair protein RecF